MPLDILNSLNPPQRAAADHLQGPLLILAGAGSGKTRVIVCRIANLIYHGVRPWNILAVTFTNKAAQEMRTRVETICPGQGRGTWVSTFHAFGAKFLRVEAQRVGLDPNFVIYDQSDQLSLIKEILKELMIEEKQCSPNQVLNAISRAKDDMLDSGSYMIHAQTHGDPFRERVARIYEIYQKKLKTANALDFGDLVMKTVEAFRDVPMLREKYQQRFQYVMVDEYQDTNHSQYLLTKYLAGPAKNICVVGDDDQSIYSWRGATIRNILEFERDYPGATVVKLEQNYRSTSKILAVAGCLIKNNTRRKAKELWTENDPGEDVQFIEMSNEQEEARFVIEEVLRLTSGRGPVIPERLSRGSMDSRQRHSGMTDSYGSALQLKDVAVFYRTNAQSRVFEDALRRHAIPYTIIGALRFYERAEIKDAISYLRVIVNTKDSVSMKRIVNLPARGLGKNSLGLLEQYAASQGISLWEAFQRAHAVSGISPAARNGVKSFVELIEAFQRYAREMGASAVARKMMEESGYWDHWAKKADDDPEAMERLDNLQELINAAKDFEERVKIENKFEPDMSPSSRTSEPEAGTIRDPEETLDSRFRGNDEPEDRNPTLARFLQEISLMTDLDEWEEQGGSLTLMTVHLAKGLEFPAVFVTGLEEGLFPIGDSAFDQDELEEERRLAYVAMTRAKQKLYLTSAASRRIFGMPRMNLPSRFIEEAGVASPKSSGGFFGPTSMKSLSGTAGDDINQAKAAYEDEMNQDVPASGHPPSSPPAASPLIKRVKLNQKVSHPDFGEGRILEIEGSGEHTKVTILFMSGVKKKLLLKYAPLELQP